MEEDNTKIKRDGSDAQGTEQRIQETEVIWICSILVMESHGQSEGEGRNRG